MKLFLCEHCDREFHDDEGVGNPGVYEYEGTVLCEDCLVDMGVLTDNTESYEIHANTLAEKK